MVSPYKLFESTLNCYKINSNEELGNTLREFFNQPTNDYLWKLSTHRQTVTLALRNTETIHLRHLEHFPKNFDTLQLNQLMEVKQSLLAEIAVFKKAVNWFEEVLMNTGANTVELGRIFISKLSPNSKVDLHTDEGNYFSYYDRFHFTVTAAVDNIFSIQDKNYTLEQDSLYWVNNHVPHWLENKSKFGRINFIVDARLS